MLEGGLGSAFEFGDDALGEDLAEFDAPLVERVDAPDGALGEDGVLIESDEFAESFGREPFQKNGVRRTITFKDAMGHEPIGGAFGLDLFRGFAESERFALRADVGDEHVVVTAEGVEGFGEGDEVAGDEARALMD